MQNHLHIYKQILRKSFKYRFASKGKLSRTIYATHHYQQNIFNQSQCMNYSSSTIENLEKNNKSIKIGCASGFWGDTPTAAHQLIKDGNVDYIMLDYLSEITMSLLTAAKSKYPQFGYAPDFVSHAIGPHLKDIKDKGIRIISNAGGINPESCAEAMKAAAKKAGVELKIAVVTGDDLMPLKDKLIGTKDMRSGISLPSTVNSMNAYLGSAPIVMGLDKGADIVITGRCTDSALALAPAIHEFSWKFNDYDLLSSGSLAGHLIECGAQVTGGTFTDWQDVHGWDNIGFPIAQVFQNGSIFITKPANTGGLISKGTVSEQMLYEIGDPKAYVLPDVICDFSEVRLTEVNEGVIVEGALGKPPTDSLKVCATYLDGYKATTVCCVGGYRSKDKSIKVANAILKRCRSIYKKMGLSDFTRTHIQVLGSEQIYGNEAIGGDGPRDVALWISVQHKDKKALQILAMEVASAGTGMAPGLTSMIGGRPKPSPLLRLHSFLVNKNEFKVTTKIDDQTENCSQDNKDCIDPADLLSSECSSSTIPSDLLRGNNEFTLRDLAYARSGDKGDSCNIGIISRKPSYLPYIQEALTKESVANYFKHVFPAGTNPADFVKRYEVNGINGLNFVLESSLGGGGIASLRSDPQGKAYGQMLLDMKLKNMPDLTSL